MKNIVAVVFTIFAGLTLLTAQTMHPDYLDGAIYVKLKNNPITYQSNQLNGKINQEIRLDKLPFYSEIADQEILNISIPFQQAKTIKLQNIYRIEFEDIQQVESVLNSLNNNANVEYAERVPLLKKTLSPNDPNYNSSSQWSLFQINASNAWDVGTGNASIKVAIVDDAVEITHPDLAPVIWSNTAEVAGNGIDDDANGYIDDINGYDVANDDNNPNPDSPISSYDHGTHVAGIAGAATNNNLGVASIGHNLTLLPVKSTNSSSFVTHGYEGIMYAVAAGADVINMSWGGSGSSITAQNIISYAFGQGIVLVAAAGNDNVSTVFYPAGYSEVISVASTTYGDAKSSFSNFGTWIDISAPGSAIYSTVPGGGYQTKQGTSMASPLVAGLAGLMLSLNPSLSPADIESCILSTADNIDASNSNYIGELGAGRINAFQAMNCISATLNWPPQADFIASTINIVEGQSVTFTDLSIYNPTTWSWTFAGGTPATFNGQNPGPITYNTAGTYEVTLTVTNSNGSDVETKTDYITVNALTGCDQISNTLPTDPNSVWTWGAPNGYILGHNFVRYNRIAESFSNFGPTYLMGADFYFVEADFVDPNTTIDIKVWADAGGIPGTELYSESITISEIAENITPTGFYATVVDFDQPVQVTGSNFFVGYQFNYLPTGGDTVVCSASNDLTADATRPNSVWVYVNPIDNPLAWPVTGWNQVSDIGSIELAMHVYPRITSAPPTAIINPSPAIVCEGEFITLDGTSSPNTTNWEWAINGTSTPYPTGSSPQIIMNAAGTHWVYMLAENYCGYYHIDSTQVTVNPTPDIALTASVDTICPGGSAMLNSTGATSYVWSPGATLSCTNCNNPTANPVTTTTYTVTGTIGSCVSDGYFTLVVDNLSPVANFLVSSDTICVSEVLSLNGSISEAGTNFNWLLNGGTPSTASGSVVQTSYGSAGNYLIDLTVENSCGLSDSFSSSIVVENCPVSEILSNNMEGIAIIYNQINQTIEINYESYGKELEVKLINISGQIIYKDLLKQGQIIDVSGMATGIYSLIVSSDSNSKILRFAK